MMYLLTSLLTYGT